MSTTWQVPQLTSARVLQQLLKRASFTSVDELQAQGLAFIEYFNATMAKPFNWTYGRKPLSV
jgi:hypothetical protein